MGDQQDFMRGISLAEEGNMAFRSERYFQAIDLYLEAICYLPPESIEMAECLDHLGQVYWRVGDIDEALQCSKRALEIKERMVPETSSMAKTLSNIGCIFHERGEYLKASYLLRGALEIRESINPWSMEVAVTCTNLGLVLMQLDQVEEAVEYHQKAREIKEDLAPKSISLARTYVNLANVCAAMRLYQNATALLRQARDIAKDLEQPPVSLLSTIDMNFGNVMYGSGNLTKAVRFYQRAIERESSLAPDSLILADMCMELGRVYEELGMREEARSVRITAINIRFRKAPVFMDQLLNKI